MKAQDARRDIRRVQRAVERCAYAWSGVACCCTRGWCGSVQFFAQGGGAAEVVDAWPGGRRALGKTKGRGGVSMRLGRQSACDNVNNALV